MPAHTLRDGREGRESPILHILEVRKQKRWGEEGTEQDAASRTVHQ